MLLFRPVKGQLFLLEFLVLKKSAKFSLTEKSSIFTSLNFSIFYFSNQYIPLWNELILLVFLVLNISVNIAALLLSRTLKRLVFFTTNMWTVWCLPRPSDANCNRLGIHNGLQVHSQTWKYEGSFWADSEPLIDNGWGQVKATVGTFISSLCHQKPNSTQGGNIANLKLCPPYQT